VSKSLDRAGAGNERDEGSAADERPAYEPPRIEKKRSVARATLGSVFHVGGTPSAGIVGPPG
jgi:hypothetical protein